MALITTIWQNVANRPFGRYARRRGLSASFATHAPLPERTRRPAGLPGGPAGVGGGVIGRGAVDGRTSRWRVWVLRGAAVVAAVVPMVVRAVRFGGGATTFAWFGSGPVGGRWWQLDPQLALTAYLHWEFYTGLGVPVLIAAVPLAARGRLLRPVALAAAVLLALTAATGAYLGPLCAQGPLAAQVTGLPGDGWTGPALYLIAAIALTLVAQRRPGRPRAGAVGSETT